MAPYASIASLEPFDPRTAFANQVVTVLNPFGRGILKCFWRYLHTFMRSSSRFWAVILVLGLLPATGCLFRTRPVEDQYSKVPLKESSQQGLIDTINQQADAMQSLKATVDIDSSAGGIKKGQSPTTKRFAATCWRASRTGCT